VVFVCENNGYAQSTPAEYAIAGPSIAARAAGYGMPGEVVDGQDAIAVWSAADRAVRRARAGEGPSLIECRTYRYHGHSSSDDPRRYRAAGEEEKALAQDCIVRLREHLLSIAGMASDELDQIVANNRALIEEAVLFAEQGPLPEPWELTTNVYVPTKRGDVQ
jgi:pyruvate dehydrogenase E1 component alpha subunit